MSCEALDFAFEVAARDTAVEGAKVVIEKKPVVVHCPHCDQDQALETPQRFVCPVCRTPVSKIVSGRELNVDRIQLEVACASG